jgi:polyhydroxybutyrate depolymerase
MTVVLAGCPFDDDDDITGPVPELLSSGLYEMESAGEQREFYLQLPADYGQEDTLQASALGDDNRKPLLIAFHGYTGSLDNWVGDEPYYDLAAAVGDGAIMVFPNALPDGNGDRNWNTLSDPEFFLDLIAELDVLGLQYNPNKLFISGHSNGAGMVHALACRYGDIIRAAAPVAGNLTTTECVGSIAIIMSQGDNDPFVGIDTAKAAESYWVLYNGWDKDQFVPSEITPCTDYSFPGELNSDYPVLWCEHSQGHDWPDFGSEAIWQFFSSLPEVEPTVDFPDGGGSERATPPSDTTLSFSLTLPAEINRPLTAAATLWPASQIDEPACSNPTIFLNTSIPLDGQVAPGQTSGVITVPIRWGLIDLLYPSPSDWALSITVYVEGGSWPIPSPGVDHDAYIPVTVLGKNIPLDIGEPIEVTPVGNPCGF